MSESVTRSPIELFWTAKNNKIILDECSTVVEIDHVRGRKTVSIGKMDDIWIDLYAYDDTGCDRLLAITGRGP